MKKENCPFCNEGLLREGDSIFQKGRFCSLILTNSQQRKGTMFIITNEHKLSPFDFSEDEAKELNNLLKKANSHMQNTLNCHGYSIYWNVGEAAGQGLDHVHLHIVPRYNEEPFAGKGPGHWIKSKENEYIKVD